MKPDFAHIDPVGRIHTDNMPKAQQRADTLRQCSCHSRSTYTEAQHSYKEHVQGNVHEGCEDQIIKWMPAVSYGMEYTHKDIIHHSKNSAAEVITEIDNGLRKHLCRCSHPAQNNRCQRNTGDCKRHAGNKAKGDRCMDSLLYSIEVFRAIGSGNDDTCTHGNVIKEADHHKDQTSGGTDCRQCILSYIIAHAPSIERIVQLLEYITQKYRQCKKKHPLPNWSFRQRVFSGLHGDPSFARSSADYTMFANECKFPVAYNPKQKPRQVLSLPWFFISTEWARCARFLPRTGG